METTTHEIADGIHRISTFIPEVGIPFNQYLVVADEPLLFHTGMKGLFPLVSEAVARVVDPTILRYVSFGHFEADECGAMNDWLGVAPRAEVVHGMTGVLVSLNDQAARTPRALADGEVLDLGGKRVRWIDTPHVPHGWDAGVMYEETTGTLLVGDLFTALGDAPALSDADIVGPAQAAEDAFRSTSITPLTAPTIRRLVDLAPGTLALMHGPAFTGDSAGALGALADFYEDRLLAGVRVSAG